MLLLLAKLAHKDYSLVGYFVNIGYISTLLVTNTGNNTLPNIEYNGGYKNNTFIHFFNNIHNI